MEKNLLKKLRSRSHRSSTISRYMLLLFVLMSVAVLAGAASFQLQHEGNRFPGGWHVAGVSISAMSPSEARQQLKQFAQTWEQSSLTIQVQAPDGTTRWRTQLTRKQLGASLDVDATLQHAWQEAQKQPPFARMVMAWLHHQAERDIQPVIQIDDTRLQAWLQKCKRQVETPPRDARLRYISAGRWESIPENAGSRLADDTTERLIEALRQSSSTCILLLEEAPPRITRQHLEQIDSEWTAVSTHFSERERNRSHNIRKAAESINGIVLLPGDEFSYNKVVGPRTLKEGFRRAPMIVKGELVPGDGGGVCQVSTTVYMAALQVGLQIVQRSHHAFPIHYAPAGLDATVVYGAIDLRFRNNTPSPIALVAEAKGGKMTVRVLGSSEHRRTVRIVRVVHAVIPPPVKTFPTDKLPPGVTKVQDKGQRGWRVSVYRVISEPGKPPVREKVATDYYRPQTRVVLVGQGQVKQETPSASSTPSALPVEAQQLP